MPNKPTDPEAQWVTIMGRKVNLGDKASLKKLNSGSKQPSGSRNDNNTLAVDIKTEQQKNVKETKKSVIVQRFNLQKSKLNFRDEVIYDNLQKSGIVGGFDGQYVKIFDKGRSVTRPNNDVFKKSEFIGDTHWDIETIDTRQRMLLKANISENYLKHDWAKIPAIIQDQIRKDGTPAGTGITTSSEGVWNPVNSDRTVDSKLKESEKKTNEKE